MNFLESISRAEAAYVIAEAADAHYGDLERAKDMALGAKKAGANAIKFQHHIPDAEMLPDTPMSSNMREPLYDFLKKNALTIGQHVILKNFCDKIGITYLCTPFSLAAALELESYLDLPVYKIGSGEMNDFPTIRKIAEFGKPLIVSTGMSYQHEVDETYDFLNTLGVDYALLNCLSAYPPQPHELKIGFTAEMIKLYPNALIGFSDHTNGITSSIAAAALGAKIIEKHVTIDPDLVGPDADVSITFEELASLVDAIKFLSLAMGSEKTVTESEREIRTWARRSLVYNSDFAVGHQIEESDIWGKRPGTGVPSKRYDEFLGKRLTRPVRANTLLAENDFA